MTDVITATPDKPAKRIGWGLMALALASPALMGAIGVLSAYKVGELTVQVGFAWLGTAVVINLLTRKRDAVTKANGRIVAAILALAVALVSGFNLYRDTQKVDNAKQELIEQFMASTVEAKAAPASVTAPAVAAEPAPPEATPQMAPASLATQVGATSEADRAVGFLSAMKVRAKQFAAESGATDRKFNAVDLGTVLVAQNLITKPAIDASRKKLNAYKAAIAERDAMLRKHFVLTEQIIRGSGMSEREVRNGMAGLNSSKGPIMQNYADLTAAQMATVKATEDILNFAQKGLGRITVEGGQAMFQTQPELDEYRRLVQAFTDAAVVDGAITQKVNEQAQSSKQAIIDQLK